MGMKLIEKVIKGSGLKEYKLAKLLDKYGVSISHQGIVGYTKPNARSMRLDVLCGFRKASGVSWSEFGKWLDEEFLK